MTIPRAPPPFLGLAKTAPSPCYALVTGRIAGALLPRSPVLHCRFRRLGDSVDVAGERGTGRLSSCSSPDQEENREGSAAKETGFAVRRDDAIVKNRQTLAKAMSRPKGLRRLLPIRPKHPPRSLCVTGYYCF